MPREKSELIKAEVLRQSKNPYHIGARVFVDNEGELYRAVITGKRNTLLVTYVDVEYDAVDGYDDNTETDVSLGRLTPDININSHARAMEAVRASTWTGMSERISQDIGPQPYYNPKARRDKRKLYTFNQAMKLAQTPPNKKKRKRQNEAHRSIRWRTM